MTPAELLREAANRIDTALDEARSQGHHYAAITPLGDEWTALLTPPVGAALADWLRAEATHAERRELLDLVGPTAGPFAVAFARSILQEEP